MSISNKNYLFIIIFGASVLVLILNIAMLHRTNSYHSDHGSRVVISSDFFSSQGVVEETKEQPRSLGASSYHHHSHHHPRYPKTLVGIITSASFNDASYRKRHRILFQIWNDTRVCSLADYRSHTSVRDHCQLIYSFIVGGNTDPNALTERLENTTANPIELPKPMEGKHHEDLDEPDVTLLNIRENMNEGKSQTFFYFASLILEEYGLDYAMKFDADSILHLHDFFLFAHNHLPPLPYNVNIFAGALRDKAGWPPGKPEEMNRKESFWGNEFEGVHLYLAGQCYLMSLDLCKFVSAEAPYSKIRIEKGGYIEGHEDHDVSGMVFHSPTPIHMITIGKSQRFWEHPVKGQPRWERIKKRETARMKGALFEGKKLRFY